MRKYQKYLVAGSASQPLHVQFTISPASAWPMISVEHFPLDSAIHDGVWSTHYVYHNEKVIKVCVDAPASPSNEGMLVTLKIPEWANVIETIGSDTEELIPMWGECGDV